MKAKKRMICMLTMMLGISLLAACSDDDTNTLQDNPSALYAVVSPEGARLIDILPEDYVMTLNNIISVNPETGRFIMKDTKRIDDVAYPVPTQYVIMFYSEGRFLFDAKLNSALSSYLPTGLTFCHLMTHESGEAWYDLGTIYVTSQDGHTEGEPTEQQAAGMRRMYQILEEAGKLYHKK